MLQKMMLTLLKFSVGIMILKLMNFGDGTPLGFAERTSSALACSYSFAP